jgi:hypothetical protein
MNMYNNNFTDSSFIDETYNNSLTSDLNQIKKKRMELNNLIHVYSHKAKNHIKRKLDFPNNTGDDKEHTTYFNGNRKIIHNAKFQTLNTKKARNREMNTKYGEKSQRNCVYQIEYPNLFQNRKPIIKDNTHQKLKEIYERSLMEKALQGRRIKEKTLLLKDNLLIMKNKTL